MKKRAFSSKYVNDYSRRTKVVVLSLTFSLICSSLVYFFCDKLLAFYSLLILYVSVVAMACFSIPYLWNDFRPYNFKNVLKFILICSCISVLIIFGGVYSFNMIRDIPNTITSSYSVQKGACNNIHETSGRGNSLVFRINDVEFKVSTGYKGVIKNGEIYKVEYLPNSKYVINIYGSKK